MSDTPRTSAAIESALAEPGMSASFDAAVDIAQKLERDNRALSNSLRSLITVLETVDSDERERAREEQRSAHVHTSAIREANATLLDHGEFPCDHP